jgi:hypothetical protein
VRHIGEEFALGPIRAIQLGRQLFEFRGAFSNATRLPALADEPEQDRHNRGDDNQPEDRRDHRAYSGGVSSIDGRFNGF